MRLSRPVHSLVRDRWQPTFVSTSGQLDFGKRKIVLRTDQYQPLATGESFPALPQDEEQPPEPLRALLNARPPVSPAREVTDDIETYFLWHGDRPRGASVRSLRAEPVPVSEPVHALIGLGGPARRQIGARPPQLERATWLQVAQAPVFFPRHEWLGRVEEVNEFTFLASLVERADPEAEVAGELLLEQVSPSERDRVYPGALFSWVVGYRDEPGGQRMGASILSFHREPAAPRPQQVEQAVADADLLHGRIAHDDE
jgi:hypothetical protein